MPQSLTKILVHIVFSTKNWEKFLTDTEVRKRLHSYIIGICKNLDSPALIVDGTDDHVHILLGMSRTRNISEIIREIKRSSTNWVREKYKTLEKFKWQAGYGAFSVSESKSAEVKNYIINQEKHHEKVTFQDEFRKLLKRHDVEFDEKYVWD